MNLLKVILIICLSYFQLFSLSSAFYKLDDGFEIGRIFDGIGALSGGGATSKLLINYPEKHRNEILDYLFKPNFGASLQILKVEIGGDGQSTDGTESSHMHESWEENYNRGYEWWLMKEAKKRNPNIKLSCLTWVFPHWVGNGTGNPYKFPELTASYVVKWILGAKKVHGLDIDYIGIWNERQYDINYIKVLRRALNSDGLNEVKIIAADDDWEISKDILKDPQLNEAVDIIGAHYPGTYSDPTSLLTKKALWASEDYSSFNDDIGAGCLARILNQNYVNGYMTSTISWNLIASYYNYLPFPQDGLMTANNPWSGHYEVSNPIWITAHTTQFTKIGWSYLAHENGVGKLSNGGSYVTLVSPDRKDFTIIIETMSHKHSACIRPNLPEYQVRAQQAEFLLAGNLINIEKFNVWVTNLSFETGSKTTAFVRQSPVKPYAGTFSINLEIDQIYTLTTLESGFKGFFSTPPPPKPFPKPYSDSFNGYEEFSEAYNFAPQSGVWEIRRDNTSALPNWVNRQVISKSPIRWCNHNLNQTMNLGGDYNWSLLSFKINFRVPSIGGSTGILVGVKVNKGGCDVLTSKGIYFSVLIDQKIFILSTDIAGKNVLLSSSLADKLSYDTWHQVELSADKDDFISTRLDSIQLIGKFKVPSGIKNGAACYGTTSFGYADFDDLLIE